LVCFLNCLFFKQEWFDPASGGTHYLKRETGMSKYDRLLFVLNLLRGRPGLSTQELARECEVSERTIYRYVTALSSANVPIYFDKGYRLLSDAFLPPLNFTSEEYLIIKMALSSSVFMKESPLRKQAKDVLAKIEANLTPTVKKDMDKLKDVASINIKSTSDFSKSSLWFKLIEQSISNKRGIKLVYESLKSGVGTREVDPYSLVFRRHAWYLAGFCRKRNEIRLFRLNRIKQITLLDKNFQVKPDFSLSDFFKDSWELYPGEPVCVKIKFRGAGAKVIESRQHHPSEKIVKLKDGSLIYEVRVSGIEEIGRWVLGFGEDAKVLEPKKLKEKIKSTIEKMKQFYG
jgi:predicted DNA-binding transcriptional regulator YafY